MQTIWTTKLVGKRMEESAQTQRLLPADKAQEYFDAWSGVIYGSNVPVRESMKSFVTPDSISRLDETLQWMNRCLDPIECKLIWRRAWRTRWKTIAAEFDRDLKTVQRKRNRALAKIAKYLNGDGRG